MAGTRRRLAGALATAAALAGVVLASVVGLDDPADALAQPAHVAADPA